MTATAPRPEPGTTSGPSRGSHDATVLVVDDSCLYREGLAAAIRHAPHVGEVRTAYDPATITSALAGWIPRVILLNLASVGSRDLLPALREAVPDSSILVLGLSEADEEEIVALAEAGVAGYLMRSEPLEHLLRLIQTVHSGDTICTPRVAAVLLRRVRTLAARPPSVGRVPVLTAREDQILDLLALGLSNREIGERLTIEVRTVKNHVHHILGKLGVRRRGEAVAVARGGRIRLGPLDRAGHRSARPSLRGLDPRSVSI